MSALVWSLPDTASRRDDWKYDDYNGRRVAGKIVVILRGEPALESNQALKDGATQHGEPITKAILARNRGAAAVVVLTGQTGRWRRGPAAGVLGRRAGAREGCRHPHRAGQERGCRPPGSGPREKTSSSFSVRSGASGTPASFAFPESLHATLTAGVKKKRAVIDNVLAYLPGKTDEYAFWELTTDHLGRANMARWRRRRSASFIPERMTTPRARPACWNWRGSFRRFGDTCRVAFSFASFAGEELGLLGSAEWVREPTLPLNKAIAMLNSGYGWQDQEEHHLHRRSRYGRGLPPDPGSGSNTLRTEGRVLRRRLLLERSHPLSVV